MQEVCGSALTVITDTPAVVLLALGPGLKCFLIFPATGSWCSFSDKPSSWRIQRAALQRIFSLSGTYTYERFTSKYWTHIDPRVIKHLYGCVSLINLYPQHPCDQSLERERWCLRYNNVALNSTNRSDRFLCFTWEMSGELPDTNLGGVRHVVPVRCREIKLALQNLFKESLLVVTAAVEIKQQVL